MSEEFLFAAFDISSVTCRGIMMEAGQLRKWGYMWLGISEHGL